jgi:hypothetical protein
MSTDLPDLEPRSSTLDALDNALAALTHARRNVLDEVKYLGTEIDRLRGEVASPAPALRAVLTDASRAELVRIVALLDRDAPDVKGVPSDRVAALLAGWMQRGEAARAVGDMARAIVGTISVLEAQQRGVQFDETEIDALLDTLRPLVGAEKGEGGKDRPEADGLAVDDVDGGSTGAPAGNGDVRVQPSASRPPLVDGVGSSPTPSPSDPYLITRRDGAGRRWRVIVHDKGMGSAVWGALEDAARFGTLEEATDWKPGHSKIVRLSEVPALLEKDAKPKPARGNVSRQVSIELDAGATDE